MAMLDLTGDKFVQWSQDDNIQQRLTEDRNECTVPTIFVSGDASLAHLVLQRDDANIFDRFLKGREIEDFYVPGGTFMLEFLLEACQEQQQCATAASSAPNTSKPYTVRGPYRRRWIFPRYDHGFIDIRAFPRDTTIIEQFPPTKSAGAHEERAYRVFEGVGFRKGHYLESITQYKKLVDDGTIDAKAHPVIAEVPPGSDDNFRLYLSRRIEGDPLPAGPFIFVLNLEFAYFGGCDVGDPHDRIADLTHIRTLETQAAQRFFILKIKHRSAWNGMRDGTERQIRTSVVEFLMHRHDKEPRSHRTLMLISADELRQANVYISNHLSWERTIQSALLELKTVERQMNTVLHKEPPVREEQDLWSAIERAASKLAYGFLILPKHLVISFGCDGAVHLVLQLTPKIDPSTLCPRVELTIQSCDFAVDPTEAEGTHSDKYPGRMRGYDSLLTASLAHRLMEAVRTAASPDEYRQAIATALIFGLKAGRFLQVHGYDLYAQTTWGELRKAVCGDTVTAPSASSRAHLYPYWLSERFVERVATLSRWALSPGETLDNLPVMPFDSLASILVHRSIKRFADQAPLHDPSPGSVVQRLYDIRRRQEREWRSLGFMQVLALPPEYYQGEQGFLHDGERDEASPEHEDANSFGYGSFDRTWWRIVDAAIPNDLAKHFHFPISLHQERHQELRFHEVHGGSDWKLNRAKSLMLAYASLVHGLDILHPARADDARSHLCRILATAVETCGSLIAFTQGLPRTECVAKIMHDVGRFVCKGLDTQAIHEAYAVSWKPRGLPDSINDVCNIVEVAGELSLEWKGHAEHVLGFLGVLCDAHQQKQSFRLLSLWLGVFPKVQIGKIVSIERREVESFRMLARILREYVGRKEEVKPLNIGVFGPAGSGKSFAVREIAQAIVSTPAGVTFLTFNLSQFKGPEELVDAFEEISDVGMQRKLPVVFWDEYDARLGTQPLGWLAYFLGPMNDGKYFHREKSRQLPKAIFVFAGSMFQEFADMHRLDYLARHSVPSKASKDTKHKNKKKLGRENQSPIVGPFSVDDWRTAKGPDFKSRLTGTLDVLGVNEPQRTNLSFRCDPFGHYIRRAAVLRSLLKEIHPQVFDAKDTLRIPANVARGFLELDEYFHGNRSIEQILRMCDFGEAKVFEYSCLPAASQFLLHASPRLFEELAEVMGFPSLRESE